MSLAQHIKLKCNNLYYFPNIVAYSSPPEKYIRYLTDVKSPPLFQAGVSG